jgi:hypothetical protein
MRQRPYRRELEALVEWSLRRDDSHDDLPEMLTARGAR